MNVPRVRRTALPLFLAVFSTLGFAQGTRLWQQNRFEEFERGTAKGVSVRSDGRLELAPAFRTVFTSPSTYIWSVASDAEGNAYLASGAPARVYKVTPGGKASILFEAKELQVQVIRIGPDGALYAATSPDGKVYRIAQGQPQAQAETKHGQSQSEAQSSSQSESAKATPTPTPKNGESTIPTDSSYGSKVFFDPKAKYIWDMTFDAQGRLYIATGDQGSIYRVDRNGEGSLFFKCDEPHFRSLLLARDGNLIAGTDGSGLIYRITPAGEAFVLYSAAKKEITALVQDGAGNLYAAGVGDKRGNPVVATPVAAPAVPAQVTATVTGSSGGQPAANPPISLLPAGSVGANGGSEIYQLAPDGSPQKIWASREDLIYCLQLLNDADSTLLVGTGNRGRVYTVTPDGRYSDLLKASANHVTQFSASKNGIYVASANLGKLFLLNPKLYEEGAFESDVFDAHTFSRWGRAEVLGHGPFELSARTGNVDNPDRNWSPWKRVDLRDLELGVPPARFAQWRVNLHPGKTAASVESVGINYHPRNVAPVVDNIAVQPGARFPSAGAASRGGSESVTVGFGARDSSDESSARGGESAGTATKDKNWIAVRWAAHDDNDDELEYSLYYRGEDETAWKLIKDHISEKFYSVESALLPDGAYVLKVVASDLPSHTPEDALTGEKVSQRFLVDTAAPRVEQLTGTIHGEQINVTFRAIDNLSPIKRAEYSVDAGDWQFLEPVTHISDSLQENYDFNIALKPAGARASAAGAQPLSNEHVVVVRVYDRYDNMSTAKTVVRP